MSDRGYATYWAEHALLGGETRSGVLLGVNGGRFESIDPETPRPAGARRLAGLTLPGCANAHSHAFQRALRSRVQEGRGDFWAWRELMYEAAGRIDPDMMLRLARATFAEMVRAGYTAVGEFHYLHHQSGGVPYDSRNVMGHALLEAAREAGIRISLLDVLYLHGGLTPKGYREADGGQRRFVDSSAEQWIERASAIRPGSGQLVGAAIHSVRAVDPEAMAMAADWARARSAPLHAHVSEQLAENDQVRARFGRTPTELLEDNGVLDGRFVAIHFTHVDARDIERLGSSAGQVCLCPTTESDLGDGIGPSVDLESSEIPICVGSDSHAVIDPFLEARAVEMNARLARRERGLHAAHSLLEMAGRAGHRAIGWDDAGEIAVGQRADLVTLALDSERTAGSSPQSAAETAVFGATASDVTFVMVDGKVVVEDGVHVSIDVARELDAVIREVFS